MDFSTMPAHSYSPERLPLPPPRTPPALPETPTPHLAFSFLNTPMAPALMWILAPETWWIQQLTEEILQVLISSCTRPTFCSDVGQHVFSTNPPTPKFNVETNLGSGNLQNFFRSKAPPISTSLVCCLNLELGGEGGNVTIPTWCGDVQLAKFLPSTARMMCSICVWKGMCDDRYNESHTRAHDCRCYLILCYLTLFYLILSYSISYFLISWSAILLCLCYPMLSHACLCYVIFYSVNHLHVSLLWLNLHESSVLGIRGGRSALRSALPTAESARE